MSRYLIENEIYVCRNQPFGGEKEKNNFIIINNNFFTKLK